MPERVIYLLRSWPRLTQTFILNEVLALEQRGVDLVLFSLVRSGEKTVQPDVAKVRSEVRYLEDEQRRSLRSRVETHLNVFVAHPVPYTRTLLLCLLRPSLAAGYAQASTLACFSHAVSVARAVASMRRSGVAATHVHAHFAHDPALVGLLVSRLTKLPFSFTAHARDLFQLPVPSLRARARAATVIVTCCQANVDYLDQTLPQRPRPQLRLIHHGVDVDRVPFAPARAAGACLRLVSVGRLVEKKGYDDLLHALAILRDWGVPFQCTVYGDGPLADRLLGLRASLGLADVVEFAGACERHRILTALRKADVFVLTPRVTPDGDRDGIPNVLVEAMASGLPVVTTSAGGIPELVRDQDSGLVADPHDAAGIARCLRRLADDPKLRHHLGSVGRSVVEADYDARVAARSLEELFRADSHGSEVLA